MDQADEFGLPVSPRRKQPKPRRRQPAVAAPPIVIDTAAAPTSPSIVISTVLSAADHTTDRPVGVKDERGVVAVEDDEDAFFCRAQDAPLRIQAKRVPIEIESVDTVRPKRQRSSPTPADLAERTKQAEVVLAKFEKDMGIETTMEEVVLIPSRTPSPLPSITTRKSRPPLAPPAESIVIPDDSVPMAKMGVVELVEETQDEDLDPELAAIAEEARRQASSVLHADGQAGEDSAAPTPIIPTEKITVTCTPRLHPSIRPSGENVPILTAFLKPLAFLAYTSVTFAELAEAIGQQKGIKGSDVVLVLDGTRLFGQGTPASLGLREKVNFEMYLSDAWEYVEKTRDQQLKKRLAEDDGDDDDNDVEEVDVFALDKDRERDENATTAVPKAESASEYLTLTLRGEDGKDDKMRVRGTTRLSAIVSEYLSNAKLDASTAVRLEFDGDLLDQGGMVGDTELEDGDMVSVRVCIP